MVAALELGAALGRRPAGRWRERARGAAGAAGAAGRLRAAPRRRRHGARRPSTRSAAAATIRFVLCPTPGETAAARLDTRRHRVSGCRRPAKLDPRIPSEYKPQGDHGEPLSRKHREASERDRRRGRPARSWGSTASRSTSSSKAAAAARSRHPDAVDGVRPPHRPGPADAGVGRRGGAGRVHPAHRQADAGGAPADPGVLPGVRHPADRQPGQGALSDAPDRARRCAPTCKARRPRRGRRLFMAKKESKEKTPARTLKVVGGQGKKDNGEGDVIDFASVRALARIADRVRSGRDRGRWRRAPARAPGRRPRGRRSGPPSSPLRAAAHRADAAASTAKGERGDVHHLAVRRHLLPRAVARGAVLRRRRPVGAQGPGGLHRRGDEADERDRGRGRRARSSRSSSRTASPSSTASRSSASRSRARPPPCSRRS